MTMPDTELRKRFDHHAPRTDAAAIGHHEVRLHYLALARYIVSNTPESREQSLALTKLEESMFWANAAIARNQVDDGSEEG